MPHESPALPESDFGQQAVGSETFVSGNTDTYINEDKEEETTSSQTAGDNNLSRLFGEAVSYAMHGATDAEIRDENMR